MDKSTSITELKREPVDEKQSQRFCHTESLCTTQSYHSIRTIFNRKTSRLHWRAPVVIVGSFVAGLVFAAIHHAFYLYWDTRQVANTTQQQWVTRGGTAFALLVKISLAVSCATAYVQLLWQRLQKDSIEVKKINRLFRVLENATAFRDLELWFFSPLLAVIALVTWWMPLIAIITPGTMTVRSGYLDSVTNMAVPQLDFARDTFGRYIIDLWAPNSEVFRVALASVISGEPLPIGSPSGFPNATYVLKHSGPTMKCMRPTPAEMGNQCYDQAIKALAPDDAAKPAYLSWSPGDVDPLTSSTTSLPCLTFSDPPLDAPSFGHAFHTNSVSPKLTVYMALASGTEAANVAACSIYNATYKTTFHFSNGISQTTTDVDVHDAAIGAQGADDPNPDGQGAYESLMSAFAAIFNGQVSVNTFGVHLTTNTLVQTTSIDQFIGSVKFDTEKKIVTWSETFIAVENTFRDIVLSLYTNPLFYVNTTSIPVHITESVNRYQYDPQDLYLAYGIGLACTLLCCVLGCLALLQNGVSYTNDFSTTVRTTRNPELETLMASSDQAGADPLPRDLGRSKLRATQDGFIVEHRPSD